MVSRVKTVEGKMMPGVYRYKFSFVKAGAEEKEYRSTGGEEQYIGTMTQRLSLRLIQVNLQ